MFSDENASYLIRFRFPSSVEHVSGSSSAVQTVSLGGFDDMACGCRRGEAFVKGSGARRQMARRSADGRGWLSSREPSSRWPWFSFITARTQIPLAITPCSGATERGSGAI
jgi:hypothetical protein